MMGRPAYLRIVRASAWYDLIVIIGFVTPWTFAAVLAGLQHLAHALGMPGVFPAFAPEQTMMANLLGSLVIVWAVLRLADTQPRYGRYDAAARFLFAAWQLYALAHGAHPVIWLFFSMEVIFGIAQALPTRFIIYPMTGEYDGQVPDFLSSRGDGGGRR